MNKAGHTVHYYMVPLAWLNIGYHIPAFAYDIIYPVIMAYYYFMVFGKAAGSNKCAAISRRFIIAAARFYLVHQRRHIVLSQLNVGVQRGYVKRIILHAFRAQSFGNTADFLLVFFVNFFPQEP